MAGRPTQARRRLLHRVYGVALAPVVAVVFLAPVLLPVVDPRLDALADAATGSTSIDVLGFLSQYGPLGVITGLLIWFARGAHQRERDRADRLEAENRRLIDRAEDESKRLNGIILERVIPAITSATRVAEDSAELLRDVQWRKERAAMFEDDDRRPKGGRS